MSTRFMLSRRKDDTVLFFAEYWRVMLNVIKPRHWKRCGLINIWWQVDVKNLHRYKRVLGRGNHNTNERGEVV